MRKVVLLNFNIEAILHITTLLYHRLKVCARTNCIDSLRCLMYQPPTSPLASTLSIHVLWGDQCFYCTSSGCVWRLRAFCMALWWDCCFRLYIMCTYLDGWPTKTLTWNMCLPMGINPKHNAGKSGNLLLVCYWAAHSWKVICALQKPFRNGHMKYSWKR